MTVAFGLSLMPEPAFAAAALPLFEDGLVEVIEWSFDMGWGPAGVPPWLDALLEEFGGTGDLLGHGVSFSCLSGAWTDHHTGWLERLRREVETRNYRHVSEHVGFVGAGRFSFSAPLPVPCTDDVVATGVDRLRRLAAAAGCPVGLENLATSFGPADALEQGAMVDELLAPVDGFVVLDLHNVWCQAVNLGLDASALVGSYPLERVREIHVSGGSWDRRDGRDLRRDTHDGGVPAPVLDLLVETMPRCANLEAIIHERLGTSLADPAGHESYRDDVRRVAGVVT